MELVTWTLGSCQSCFCECDVDRAHACTLRKRRLFLILLVRGRLDPCIQITLFSVPHIVRTGRNIVSPLTVIPMYLPGTLIADFFSVVPEVDFTGLVHLTIISTFLRD